VENGGSDRKINNYWWSELPYAVLEKPYTVRERRRAIIVRLATYQWVFMVTLLLWAQRVFQKCLPFLGQLGPPPPPQRADDKGPRTR
jgi:uncharacterized membrane protein